MNEWMKRDDLFELKAKSMVSFTCGVIFCSSPTHSCHTTLLQKPDTKSDAGHETTPCSAGCGCGCPVLSWDDGTTWHCNTLEKRKAESGKYIKDQFSKISTPSFVSMQKSQEIWSRQFQTVFSFQTHGGSCDTLLMIITDNCQSHLEDSSAQDPSMLQLHQSASAGG